MSRRCTSRCYSAIYATRQASVGFRIRMVATGSTCCLVLFYKEEEEEEEDA